MTNFEYFKSRLRPETVALMDSKYEGFCYFVTNKVYPECEECPLHNEPDCVTFGFRLDYLKKEHEEEDESNES